MRPIKEDKGRVRPVVEDDFQCDENGNSTRIYEVLSIVGYAKADGTKLGYISKTNVPIGIPITDTKYWYPFQVIGVPKGDKGDRGDDGKSAYDLYIEHGGTIAPVEAWIASLKGKDGRDGKDGKDGKDGRPLQLRISSDGQSIEISSDDGETWYIFEKNFSKLRILGYIDSISELPRNANIGDIYGVKIPDEEVEEEYKYNLYINTVTGWNLDYTITKVYDYDTELPSSATNGTTALVPVSYLTLDKEKIDGYKVYRFSLEKNGWILILDTAEIYASKEDIINHGDNVYALVQGDEEHTYKLYKRVVSWVYFGKDTSITYVLIQDINDGTENNILSSKAVTDAYGHYIESPEFVRVYLDDEDKILWGIKTDGTIYYGADVPPQIKTYIDSLNALIATKLDAEGLDSDALKSIKFIENPNFLKAITDLEGKILAGRTSDGTAFENIGFITPKVSIGGHTVDNIEDPEERNEIIIDSDNKIISYRDSNGVRHENAGIESKNISTNSLNLTDEGMSEFQQALKNAGFQPGGAGDYTDYISKDGETPLYIDEPRCAYVNISGIDAMPTAKGVDLQAYMEVYDYNGNYFKKKVILNAQGNSSLANPQKNFAVDIFDSDWNEDAFSLKIGNWVPQDSFHFKCFYYDPSRGLADVIFKFAEDAIKFTNTRPNRLVLKKDITTVHSDVGVFSHDYCSEPLCHPDGFPAVVYLNGEFYGLFAWNLKKHRDNYMMDKKDYESVHIDSDTANLWSSNALDWTLFEIRNPKTLICMDGSKYDGDNPKELIDSSSEYYDASNKDHKNTVKTKNLINTLHTIVPTINAAATTEEKKALFEQYFDVESFIVFWIISQVTDNYDGLWGRNTQWLYYKESGKWCPSLYDLDSCIGYMADVAWLYEPYTYILAQDNALPYGLLYSLYKDEIIQIYSELRNNGIIGSGKFIDLYIDWCNRFGNFNLKRSIEKWDTPCYRDGNINAEYWKQTGYGIASNISDNLKYNENKNYSNGDVAYYGVGFYLMQYTCIKACRGEVPATPYNTNPFYGGVFDSPRRVKKWLDEKIAILDAILEYNV